MYILSLKKGSPQSIWGNKMSCQILYLNFILNAILLPLTPSYPPHPLSVGQKAPRPENLKLEVQDMADPLVFLALVAATLWGPWGAE